MSTFCEKKLTFSITFVFFSFFEMCSWIWFWQYVLASIWLCCYKMFYLFVCHCDVCWLLSLMECVVYFQWLVFWTVVCGFNWVQGKREKHTQSLIKNVSMKEINVNKKNSQTIPKKNVILFCIFTRITASFVRFGSFHISLFQDTTTGIWSTLIILFFLFFVVLDDRIACHKVWEVLHAIHWCNSFCCEFARMFLFEDWNEN